MKVGAFLRLSNQTTKMDALQHGPDTEELLKRIADCDTKLRVNNLRIHSLPELPVRIQELYCHNTPLTSLPELHEGLISLDCDDTPMTSLSQLPTTLKFLCCSCTKLTSLPELPTGLIELAINDTQISLLPELPVSLLKLYTWDTSLLIQRNIGEPLKDYKSRWATWREEQASKKRIQERAKVLKEEIAMEAWKPERLEKWLEIGYDPDD